MTTSGGDYFRRRLLDSILRLDHTGRMTAFQIGDKVTCVDNQNVSTFLTEGDVYTVADVWPGTTPSSQSGELLTLKECGYRRFLAARFALYYTPKTEENTVKFKVGDVVVCVTHDNSFGELTAGDTYVVTKCVGLHLMTVRPHDDKDYRVDPDHLWSESRFELRDDFKTSGPLGWETEENTVTTGIPEDLKIGDHAKVIVTGRVAYINRRTGTMDIQSADGRVSVLQGAVEVEKAPSPLPTVQGERFRARYMEQPERWWMVAVTSGLGLLYISDIGQLVDEQVQDRLVVAE